MKKNESLEKISEIISIAIYAILTWFWFDMNNSDSLPIIGHTELVHGWVNSNADKFKLITDLIYFAISVATMAVATEIIVSQVKLPFFNFKEDCGMVAAVCVNFVVFLYEFHILEFRLKLIGLTIGLIIFFFIATAIYMKIMEILKPILKITDVAETISDVTNITDHDDKK